MANDLHGETSHEGCGLISAASPKGRMRFSLSPPRAARCEPFPGLEPEEAGVETRYRARHFLCGSGAGAASHRAPAAVPSGRAASAAPRKGLQWQRTGDLIHPLPHHSLTQSPTPHRSPPGRRHPTSPKPLWELCGQAARTPRDAALRRRRRRAPPAPGRPRPRTKAPLAAPRPAHSLTRSLTTRSWRRPPARCSCREERRRALVSAPSWWAAGGGGAGAAPAEAAAGTGRPAEEEEEEEKKKR